MQSGGARCWGAVRCATTASLADPHPVRHLHPDRGTRDCRCCLSLLDCLCLFVRLGSVRGCVLVRNSNLLQPVNQSNRTQREQLSPQHTGSTQVRDSTKRVTVAGAPTRRRRGGRRGEGDTKRRRPRRGNPHPQVAPAPPPLHACPPSSPRGAWPWQASCVAITLSIFSLGTLYTCSASAASGACSASGVSVRRRPPLCGRRPRWPLAVSTMKSSAGAGTAR